MKTDRVTIELTTNQHRELLAILTRHTLNHDRWTISPGLRRAVLADHNTRQ